MKLKFITKPETKPKRQKSALREWGDAILFAVVAATLIRWATFEAYTIPTPSMEKSLLTGDYLFVSKLHYGPRTPRTPLQVPLTHQTIWGTNIPSYSDAIQLKPFRFPGFSKVKNNDVVVFNYPPDGEHLGYPVDLRTNYIKRCIGIAGDKVEVRNMDVYVNDKRATDPAMLQYSYLLTTNSVLTQEFFEANDLNLTEVQQGNGIYLVHTTPENAEKMKQFPIIKSVQLQADTPGAPNPQASVYPNLPARFNWNKDNYGPIHVPKAGETITLDSLTIPLYGPVIEKYEYNEQVQVSNDKVLMNGKEIKSYTFKQNYYFMMGDNRHDSADSRFWGFVPEDHIVGKAVLIWMSADSQPGQSTRIRWNRIFNIIH